VKYNNDPARRRSRRKDRGQYRQNRARLVRHEPADQPAPNKAGT